MGLKRVILERSMKDQSIVKRQEQQQQQQQKHTDFSIRKILSDSPWSNIRSSNEILDLSKTQEICNYEESAYQMNFNKTTTISSSSSSSGLNQDYQKKSSKISDFIVKPKVMKFWGGHQEFNGCDDCDLYFKNLNYSNHLKSTNFPTKHNETFVENLLIKSVQVNLHNINQSPFKDDEITYKCRICEKVFGCENTLQIHERTHKASRYECTDCGKGFSQLRNYKYHISVHRGTKEFAAECTECGKVFNDKGYLSSHMKIHRNKKEYECPYCPKSFNQRVAFNMHVRIHTGVKPHKCTECGKRFSRKMLLKQHMRTHSGEKPYQCSVCGKSFADRSNMTLHHRLHSGIKPFTCPICPKAFTKKHHLKTHLNYHTGCKPYVCPHLNCNQAFTQSSNMRTHAKKCQFKPIEPLI